MSDLALLLWPKWRTVVNASKKPGESKKTLLLVALASVFFMVILFASHFIFTYIITRFDIFDIHWGFNKALLNMAVVTFMAVLIFSNIITALSTFFLAEDLQLLGALPVSRDSLFISRFIEQLFDSSWMIVIFGTPVFVAFGVTYNAQFYYYASIPAMMFPFILVPAGLGIIITMSLVSAFPARRLRDVLFLLIIIGAGVILTLFRIVKPEQLFNPSEQEGLMEWANEIQFPEFLPSSWVTNTFTQLVEFNSLTLNDWLYVGLTWATGLGMVAIALLFARYLYEDSFSKSQEATRTIISRTSFVNMLISFVSAPFSISTRQMVMKDIKSFMRDTSQWSQLFLLIGLMVIYVFNFKAIDAGVDAQFAKFSLGVNVEKVKLDVLTIVSYGNIGLAGFVLAALAARFVFPMVSLEGRAFWIIKSSPLPLDGFLKSKFIIGFIPLLFVGEILICVTNYVLGVGQGVWITGIIMVSGLAFAITGLALGLGARYPKFHIDNPAKVATSFGGVIYMIISMTVIGVIVGFIVQAMVLYKMSEYGLDGTILTQKLMAWIAASHLVGVILIPLAALLPMRIGLKWIEDMEIG